MLGYLLGQYLVLIIGIIAAVSFGINKKAEKPYWVAMALALLSHASAQLLFSAGGDLEMPEKDGLITRLVRAATNDGPAVLAVLPFALGFGWIVPAILLKRAVKTLPVTSNAKK